MSRKLTIEQKKMIAIKVRKEAKRIRMRLAPLTKEKIYRFQRDKILPTLHKAGLKKDEYTIEYYRLLWNNLITLAEKINRR